MYNVLSEPVAVCACGIRFRTTCAFLSFAYVFARDKRRAVGNQPTTLDSRSESPASSSSCGHPPDSVPGTLGSCGLCGVDASRNLDRIQAGRSGDIASS